jgi:hypothetical protein
MNLEVTNGDPGDGGTDWLPSESWPIQLGLGVKLLAPGVHFTPPASSPTTAFLIAGYSATDVAPVAIKGGPFDTLVVGIDKGWTNLSGTTIAIDDGSSVDGGTNPPLELDQVWLNGTSIGLRVGPGGSATLGSVIIGSGAAILSRPPPPAPIGTTGILCQGSASQLATIQSGPIPSLVVDSQSGRDIDVEDYCDLSLTSANLGLLAEAYTTGGCFAKTDATGLFVGGNSSVNVGTFIAECMDGYGLYLTGSANGVPNVTVGYGEVFNCGCAGAYLNGGATLLSGISFQFNQVGLQIDDDDAGVAGTITQTGLYANLSCNSAAEPSNLCRAAAGADLLNTSSAGSVDATGLGWDHWDSARNTTQIWACTDRTLQSCRCHGPACPTNAPTSLPDDADAVFLTSNSCPTPIDVDGGHFSNGCP